MASSNDQQEIAEQGVELNKSPPPQQPLQLQQLLQPPTTTTSLQDVANVFLDSQGIQRIGSQVSSGTGNLDEHVIDTTAAGTAAIGQQEINATERMHERDANVAQASSYP